MEENKVVLKLEDYIKMLDEIKDYKKVAENINSNYDRMCNYLKEINSDSSGEYHIKNVIEDKLNLDEPLNVKLKNYHYENLANEFIKVGITFDLIEKLVDSMIIEYKMKKGGRIMKVGDYVRTNDGDIGKIIKCPFKSMYLDEIWGDIGNFKTIITKNIYKTSPNIIDLIEVGDIVRIETEKDDTNIFEVVAINYNESEIDVFNNNFEFDWASIKQLKSIVTKEQFESMEYKIGE